MHRRTLSSLALSIALAAGMSVGVGLIGGSTALGQGGGVGTSVTYQGQLKNNGVAVNSPADVRFSIWDAATAGNQIGATDTKIGVAVSQGLFSTTFDCGVNPYTADAARWLQIEVRNPSNVGGFVLLGSRQRLTAAPFSAATRGINVDAAGNVGIGVGAPGFPLEVSGRVKVRAGASGSGGIWYTDDDTPATERSFLGRGSPTDRWTGVFSVLTGSWPMIVKDSGNVGIGTSTPQSALQVAGLVNSFPTTGGVHMGLDSPNGAALVEIVGPNGFAGIDFHGGVNQGNFGGRLLYTGGDDALRVEGVSTFSVDGNVGIGTTGGSSKLNVAGPAGFTGQIGNMAQFNNPTGNRLSLAVNDRAGIPGVAEFNLDRPGIGWGDIAMATQGGNVGIATTTPSHKLTVGSSPNDTNTMRLIGPTGSFGWNSRLNLGDDDYVRISENDDDFLDLKGINGIRAANTFSAPVKNFRIDHPSDPQNMILNHGCIESDQYVNLYRGNAIIGNDGGVWIQLPSWMNDLNTDFTYVLTSVGAAQPNLFVAAEVNKNNQFRVAGGVPGAKVSWIVTGVRQDAYVQANPLVVEEVKQPKDRGTYLSPNSFGIYTDEELAKYGNRK